ncbi:MAG: BrnT family toxin [Verrucomicrobiae bacterium]|nr:BrnT family toxin [Verrucomicrobiae bacterium]
MRFEWDSSKGKANLVKHGVDFETAQAAFDDPRRILLSTPGKSVMEPRYWCIGMVNGGILTVSFTLRAGHVRIINAGYFKKGKAIYEEKHCLQG